MTEKLCCRCETVKPADEFYADITKPMGLSTLCKLCKRETVKQWKIAHPEKNAVYVRKHRNTNHTKVKIANREGAKARRLAPKVYAEHGRKCLACLSTVDTCMDHVVPISKGGPTVVSNLQPLCRPCNTLKGDDSWDFRGSYRE
jgi:5-methylcytosine-specific restriction endonuclease McrA